MAKNRFAAGMAVYALVFLILAGFGLKHFWDFLAAYENSRPRTAVDAYVAGLTVESVIAGAEDLLRQMDGSLQSREDAEQVIRDSLTGEFRWGRKSGADYVLLSGEQVIGTFEIAPGEEDSFGFTPWTVSEESFDLSYLMGTEVTVTVPESYQVRVNGLALDDSYIAQREIPYSVLEDFSGEYEMPYLVRYIAGGFLGEADVEVLDAEGRTVTDLTDTCAFLDVCSDAEKADIEKAMEVFLGRYVTFTGSANDMALENYYNLRRSLVADSALAKRLYTAIDGLTYAQSYSDEIQSIDYGRILKVDESRYLCEAVYFVRTSGRGGVFTTENRVKVILMSTESGLKVEAMTRM